MLKELLIDIIEEKRSKRIIPALATELDLKNELTRRGFRWSPESFSEMLQHLEQDDEVRAHRLLRYKGYSLRNADITKDDT